MRIEDIKVGQSVVLTPDPNLFTDPSDYTYVTREDGPAGRTFEVESVNEPTPARPDLPRSGVPTVTLIERRPDGGVTRAYLALAQELEPA